MKPRPAHLQPKPLTPAEKAERHKRKVARVIDALELKALFSIGWLAERAHSEEIRLKASREILDRVRGPVPVAKGPGVVINNNAAPEKPRSLADLFGLKDIPRAPVMIDGKVEKEE